MSATLYDDDILAWSEQQAALLRRTAAGERVDGLDWLNLIEEIDSVGRSQLQACESLLMQALRHLQQVAAWPDCDAVPHWRSEATWLLLQARRRFTPSMRPHIDVQALHDDMLHAIRHDEIDGKKAGPVADLCPLGLDELLAPRPDAEALAARLRVPEPA